MQGTRWERALGVGSKPQPSTLGDVDHSSQPHGSDVAIVLTKKHSDSKQSTDTGTRI